MIPQRATAQVSPQLLAFFRRNLPQALCLRSLLLVARRKKDNDDNEVLVNTLADEETAFLVQELNKFNSEIDEPCATLNVLMAVLPQCWNYAVRRTVVLLRPLNAEGVEGSVVDFSTAAI